jgi:hypothetical protein
LIANNEEEQDNESSNNPNGVEKFNENDYFEKRRSGLAIEFKKEPPKSTTVCFEVS